MAGGGVGERDHLCGLLVLRLLEGSELLVGVGGRFACREVERLQPAAFRRLVDG